MFLLKLVTVLAVSLLTLQMLRFMIGGLKAAKVRAKSEQPARKVTRLAQDPRTGIYYPEQ
ncbi:MAG: hypothetical protein H7X89_11500 [Rhizobiales bacterium]|nr:hypothetical protein [Hyphomicrobiales bacterium]